MNKNLLHNMTYKYNVSSSAFISCDSTSISNIKFKILIVKDPKVFLNYKISSVLRNLTIPKLRHRTNDFFKKNLPLQRFTFAFKMRRLMLI